MDFKAIGQRIKTKRKNMGLTQETLSEKLNISVEYLSRIESGSVTASFALLEKISDTLETNEEELLFGKEISDDLANSFNSVFRNLPQEKQYAIIKIIRIISEI